MFLLSLFLIACFFFSPFLPPIFSFILLYLVVFRQQGPYAPIKHALRGRRCFYQTDCTVWFFLSTIIDEIDLLSSMVPQTDVAKYQIVQSFYKNLTDHTKPYAFVRLFLLISLATTLIFFFLIFSFYHSTTIQIERLSYSCIFTPPSNGEQDTNPVHNLKQKLQNSTSQYPNKDLDPSGKNEKGKI